MLRHMFSSDIPMDKLIMVVHCIHCDTYKQDFFLKWVHILQIGDRVEIPADKPSLHLENIQHGLDCMRCIKEDHYGTATMVIFEWGLAAE